MEYVNAYLNKCKALVHALGFDMEEEDRDALIWLLEENFEKLDEAIGKSQMK